jgi:hypothetical protein
VLWNLEGLTRSEFGNFTLTLSRWSLPVGEIKIRLYGLRGKERNEIGGYKVRMAT